MNKAVSILIAGALALGGCQRPVEEYPLAGAQIGGPFVLTGEDGKKVDSRRFDGRYRMIYFGYTFCPDFCPADMGRLMRGYRDFARSDPARGARVVPIFITVDPVRDTPAVLKEWTDSFDPRLIGLTGTPAEASAVEKAYAVIARAGAVGGSGSYLVDHSRFAILFGPRGEPITLLPHDGEATVIAAELDRWVR